MKRLTIFFILICSIKAIGQGNVYDSVTIYSLPFFSETHNRMDRYSLPFYSDTLKVKDTQVVRKLFAKLNYLLSSSPKAKLKELRKDYSDSTIDVRALFIFYKGGKETVIGVSAQQMMFLDNKLFVGDNKKFEQIMHSTSKELYDALFVGKR